MYRSFSPRYIYWELCNHCNLKCKHCFANCSPHKESFMDISVVLSRINEINSVNKVPIRFGGGEPFLYPDFDKLLHFYAQKQFPLAITTNGTLINNENIRLLCDCNLQTITVSIDGLEGCNDSLRGIGNFKRACKGLDIALNNGLAVSLSFTVTSWNYPDLFQYVKYFYRKGIKDFYFFRYIPDEMGVRANDLLLDAYTLLIVSKEIEQIKQHYSDIKLKYEKRSFFSFLINNEYKSKNIECNFRKRIITVKYDGSIVVCAAISKVLGNILYDDFFEIEEKINREINSINCIPIECRNCQYVLNCRGGCKSYSYQQHKNYEHKDASCFLQIYKFLEKG